MDYHLTLEIDIEADSHSHAVAIALEVQRDPHSLATHLVITDKHGERWESTEE
jgi:hypothetical protein